jgi:demethylmenaquinone methyltransferase/2-methoxy-6-polyprenyl-1,4-benzoquinol methylase
LRIASSRTDLARNLFSGIAPEYDRMGRIMSFGQDGRWRRFLVSRIAPPRAAGPRRRHGNRPRGAGDRSSLRRADRRDRFEPGDAPRSSSRDRPRRLEARVSLCLGQAERLPFGDGAFDAVTFTYLLRYVNDPAATLAELARVLKPGGVLAGLEFGVPRGTVQRVVWRGYTQRALPLIGRAQSREWADTGRFLGPNISAFYEDHPLDEQLAMWRRAGIGDVSSRSMSFGVGVVTWGTRE